MQPGTLTRTTELRRGGLIRRARRGRRARPVKVVEFTAAQIEAAIAEIRCGTVTVAQAAREVGCTRDHLRGLTWEVVRAAVFFRDNWLCVACGAAAVDVQHRLARGSGGTSRPLIAFGMANLISLCRACHQVAEDRDPQSHRLGYWLEQGQNPAVERVFYVRETREEWLWPTNDGQLLDHCPCESEATA